MPTPLDRALSSKASLSIITSQNAVLAFTGIVTAAAAWSIWGTDMFPKEEDPTGDPATWSKEELRRWLAARDLHPQPKDTKEQLLERVKANLRVPRKS